MRKIIILALMSISLMACNNDNEKAMQDALNKAGIKISQQDSIIAAQSYKCNYVLTYRVDTIDFLVDHDTIVRFPYDTTKTWDGKIGHPVFILRFDSAKGSWVTATKNGYRGFAKTLHFKNKSNVYMDSILASVYKTTFYSSLIMRTDVDTLGFVQDRDVNGKLIASGKFTPISRTKKVCRQIFVHSYDLKKDYYNLYNAPKNENKIY
jgi:hypothetical protein